MKKKPVRNATRIAGYDANHITIRGRELVSDLMGNLSFSQMILLQLLGRKPSRAQTRILDAVLVTIMEHGLVPSAIVSRLTHYGAPESVQGAVAAGLLGVGDQFAGTASACALLLEPLAAAPRAQRSAMARVAVSNLRAANRPVPGFGHPIHRRGDPRVKRLIAIVKTAGAKGEHLAALATLTRCVHQEIGKGLVTNISAALAAAMGEAGVPAQAMRGIIMTARCAGLAGHVYEESQHPVAPAMWQAIERQISYDSGG